MSLPADFLDRLRGRVKLSDVASKWVTWDTRKSNPKSGSYWATCPFHDEETSSFHIDDQKGFYYCFGCHAKGDHISLAKEMQGVEFDQAVRQLAFVAGMDQELAPQESARQMIEPPMLLQIKDLMVEHFNPENYLEVGALTGWTKKIKSHDRLLRSLHWGDPDYPGNVIELLTRMEEAKDGSFEKLQVYIERKFATESQAIIEATAFSEARRSLGYHFVQSRDDIIGVMMPFGNGFGGVYEAIKAACSTTPLPARRADEVWNSSVLINDILELINHSAVVICDLTGRNENVFYELGIAHAWGKPVIPITQRPEDVPFDLRHHRYLTYLNNSEGLTTLQSGLADRLQSIIEKRVRI
ncbi:MAG: hypothetical protein CSA72_09715 [Rhodobacterales bacterium]|nr:MAG: hypothetical protein CSA72_09715 [Rhodobacterales bacterium]